MGGGNDTNTIAKRLEETNKGLNGVMPHADLIGKEGQGKGWCQRWQ